MHVQKVEAFPLMLPMKRSFAISGGTVGDVSQGAPHIYVKVTAENGLSGWGEARPSHRWSYETLETVVSTIRHYLGPALVGKPVHDLQGMHRAMNSMIAAGVSGGQPIAKAAVDMALHDLIGKLDNKSLPELWYAEGKSSIELSYLITTREPEEAGSMARHAKEKGYTALDVKIGLNPSQDVAVLEAVKAEAPELYFRVDANQAYDLPQALRIVKEMARIGVDVFEQPLKANNLLGHAELRRRSDVPIALDESIWSASDMMQAIRLEACDTIVIKLTKMGGLMPAKLCGELAREAGLGLLGGGLTESSIGLTASAHLFNYLGIHIPVDLNGPIFLQDDPVEDCPIVNEAVVSLPNRPGIGCVISESKLQQYSSEGRG
ncbi:mandelate racemase/muconate lactonizing enzyme family protein [Paenibacillus marinisediminis]